MNHLKKAKLDDLLWERDFIRAEARRQGKQPKDFKSYRELIAELSKLGYMEQ